MANILIAEDDETIRTGLVTLLEGEFHDVVGANDGEMAYKMYTQSPPDLMILDVMMPRKSGLELCREIRLTDKLTRVLFLSAKNSEVDKVLGLEMGGDDYLSKPFGTAEFLARVRALLRRPQAGTDIPSSPRLKSFRLGKAYVRGEELLFQSANGKCFPLTAREFMILKILATRPMWVVSKDELMTRLWGHDYQSSSRTLDQHVHNLRKKVHGNGFSIDSVYRVGFRLSFL